MTERTLPKAYDEIKVKNTTTGFLPSQLGRIEAGQEGTIYGFEYIQWMQIVERIEEEQPDVAPKRRRPAPNKVAS